MLFFFAISAIFCGNSALVAAGRAGPSALLCGYSSSRFACLPSVCGPGCCSVGAPRRLPGRLPATVLRCGGFFHFE
jgi:hypothetical protein